MLEKQLNQRQYSIDDLQEGTEGVGVPVRLHLAGSAKRYGSYDQ